MKKNFLFTALILKVKAFYYPVIATVLVATITGFSSCSIQKRYYRSGFNIEWGTKKNARHIHEGNIESLPAFSVPLATRDLKTTNSLPITAAKQYLSPKSAHPLVAERSNFKQSVSYNSNQATQVVIVREAKTTKQQNNENDGMANGWFIAGGGCGDIALVMFFIFTTTQIFLWVGLGLLMFAIGGIFIGIGGDFGSHDSKYAAALTYIGYIIGVPFYLIYLAVKGIIKLFKGKSNDTLQVTK
jgi:hypothetical protein